jgi:hypothetical protein
MEKTPGSDSLEHVTLVRILSGMPLDKFLNVVRDVMNKRNFEDSKVLGNVVHDQAFNLELAKNKRERYENQKWLRDNNPMPDVCRLEWSHPDKVEVVNKKTHDCYIIRWNYVHKTHQISKGYTIYEGKVLVHLPSKFARVERFAIDFLHKLFGNGEETSNKRQKV